MAILIIFIIIEINTQHFDTFQVQIDGSSPMANWNDFSGDICKLSVAARDGIQQSEL